MTRDAWVFVAVMLLALAGFLFWRASLPVADPYAAVHARLAAERQHGEAAALREMCVGYRRWAQGQDGTTRAMEAMCNGR